MNRRFHSGIIIYVSNSLIVWYSKSQNTVESSSFSLYFVAFMIVIDIIEALWYKLRFLGVTVDGSADIFCEKKLDVKNSIIPTSISNKRKNIIFIEG